MEPEILEKGICHECSSQNNDPSQQKVCLCQLCNEWFCKEHADPRLPPFTEWDAIRNFPFTTELKVLYYKERKLKGGHPDMVYLRKKINALGIDQNAQEGVLEHIVNRVTHL